MGFLQDILDYSDIQDAAEGSAAPSAVPGDAPMQPKIDAGLRTAPSGITYRVATKAGSCRGRRRGYTITSGSVTHAVPVTGEDVFVSQRAACGAWPSIMWSEQSDADVSCPQCRKRIGL